MAQTLPATISGAGRKGRGGSGPRETSCEAAKEAVLNLLGHVNYKSSHALKAEIVPQIACCFNLVGSTSIPAEPTTSCSESPDPSSQSSPPPAPPTNCREKGLGHARLASYTVCLCWFYILVHTVVICKVGLALDFHAHSFLAPLL